VQDDGLDTALPTQVDQPEPLSLAPTGLEVHQQDRVMRSWRALDSSGWRG
jgi:hypothetical protein